MEIDNFYQYCETRAEFDAHKASFPEVALVFLEEEGREVLWAHGKEFIFVPSNGGNGKFLAHNGTTPLWEGSDEVIKSLETGLNALYAQKKHFWFGSEEEYEEIQTKDADTAYFIMDEGGTITYLTTETADKRYVLKTDLASSIASALEDYVTSDQLDIAKAELTSSAQQAAQEAAQAAISNATESGAIKEVLDDKVSRSEISDMATQSWVNEQGFLKEVPEDVAKKSDLEGLATESYVNSQGFIKEDALSPYAKANEVARDFVAKEGDKVLSTNDYTNADKAKVEAALVGELMTEDDYDQLQTKEQKLYLILEEE